MTRIIDLKLPMVTIENKNYPWQLLEIDKEKKSELFLMVIDNTVIAILGKMTNKKPEQWGWWIRSKVNGVSFSKIEGEEFENLSGAAENAVSIISEAYSKRTMAS
jgi:hypothetical protein